MKKTILLFALCGVAAAWGHNKIPVPDVQPAASGWQVVINIPQQRMFLYRDGELDKVYPVGVGKARTPTVLGEHTIGVKAFNPTWHIPLSIQRERGDGVKTVPPGPANPLGPVFVRLGNPKLGLGIHGTSNPASVPGVVSHGCVRMKSPHALEFAQTVSRGSPAVVSYETAALNVDDAGHLWLAVFKDPYYKRNLKTDVLQQVIRDWGEQNGMEIHSGRIRSALKLRNGKPVCLSCGSTKQAISGSLISLAWNSGSILPTQPKARVEQFDEPVEDSLPEGSAIEVDVGDADGGQEPPMEADVRQRLPEPIMPVDNPYPIPVPMDGLLLLPVENGY